jgi:TonB-linked SusC/RagA family outer membrane protein
MRKNLLTCLLLCGATGAYAGRVTTVPASYAHGISRSRLSATFSKRDVITGVVHDENGKGLPGVSISIKGTSKGATTDANGNFSLSANQGDVLVFTYIGYAKQEVTVGANTSLTVNLKLDAHTLTDVVVTALGEKRSQKSLTYSAQQIGNDQLTSVKTDNMMNSLNGKVAGVTISPSSSGVGGSTKVALRGVRSAQGNNQPLYVIDGVPISNAGSNGNGQTGSTNIYGAQDAGDGISNLNPDDIESITVLEGASASALYGSQAQNGVIVITTKKGKAGKTDINFASLASIDHPAYLPKFQDKYGQTDPTTFTSWGAPLTSSAPNNTDVYLKNGTNFTNSINLSAGSEMLQTYFSYANTYATGVEPGNTLKRNNFNLNETGHFLNNKLTVNANVNYIDQEIQNAPNLGFYQNPLVALYLFPRGVDIRPYRDKYETLDAQGLGHENWIVSGDDLHQQNPWWIKNRVPNVTHRNRFLLNGSVRYDFTDWLNVQVRGTVDRAADNYESDIWYGGDQTYATGSGIALRNQVLEHKYGDAIINFKVPMKSALKIDGLVGTSITDDQLSGTQVNSNLAIPNLFTVANTIASPNYTSNVISLNGNADAGPYIGRSQLQAIFGSVNFSFKDMIYLNATARNDWSSNLSFTPNVSYFYPSVGLSFILSQMVNMPSFVSYAKVRGSFAQVGNTVPPYLTNIQNTEDVTGSVVFNQASAFRTLKPEKTNSYEVGTDWRFAHDRINFNFTWYKTNTRNQYFKIIPSAATLNTYGYVNAGNIENTGLEFIVGADVIKSNTGLSWNTSINGSYNKNTILDVDSKDGITQFSLGGSDKYMNVLNKGGSYGDIYGTTMMKDNKGRIVLKGTGTADDPYVPQANSGALVKVGNPNPKFTLGWNNTFSYKKFNLSFLVDGKFGGQVLSYTQAYLDAYGVSKASGDARAAGGVKVNGVDAAGNAVSTVEAKAWYTASSYSSTSQPSLTVRDQAIVSQYIYSATVVRLREAALGYTFPVANSVFKSLNLAITGRNLIYFYKKAPFDPELTSNSGNANGGFDMFSMPATRNIGASLKVNF